jgi:hypothetical protein
LKYLLFLIILLCSCSDKVQKNTTIINLPTKLKKNYNDILSSENIVSCGDYKFFADSLLHGHQEVLKYYLKKYLLDSCQPFYLNKIDLINNFEGVAYIGDINHNKIKDSVFVLEPISYCKIEGEDDTEGDAYYFTDTTLPRLQTGSECCHPKNLFSVGDIDEDGIAEIGQFYSSCVSHYKSLHVFSLKNNKWNEIGRSTFDLHYMDTEKPFSYWVKKIGKNNFKMLQITDLTDKPYKMKRQWLKFVMRF